MISRQIVVRQHLGFTHRLHRAPHCHPSLLLLHYTVIHTRYKTTYYATTSDSKCTLSRVSPGAGNDSTLCTATPHTRACHTRTQTVCVQCSCVLRVLCGTTPYSSSIEVSRVALFLDLLNRARRGGRGVLRVAAPMPRHRPKNATTVERCAHLPRHTMRAGTGV